MYFYYIVLSFVFWVYLYTYSAHLKNAKSTYIFVLFLFFILVSGIKAPSVGGDLNHYLPSYESFGKQSWEDLFTFRTKYGYVFAILCKIAYTIDSSRQSFLFVTSIFSLIFVADFIKKYSPIPWLSIYIYVTMAFYTNTFNSVRSSIALGVGLYMMKYIINRNFIKFFICYVIALEIHQTFFPFILLYPLFAKQISVRYILICISISFLISQASTYVSFISVLAFVYDSGSYLDTGDSYTGGYSLFFLLSAMSLGFYIINRRKMTKELQLFIHCLIMASCIQAFATYYTVLTRVSMFFYITLIVLFPITLLNIGHARLRKLGYTITVILFFVYFQKFVMTPLSDYGDSNSQRTLPYKTYFVK